MRKTDKHDAVVLSSDSEKDAQARLAEMLKDTPLPADECLANLGLYLTSKNLSRLLFFNEIYKKILGLHGIAIEFGVRWGQTLSLLSALRGIYEPFNRHRKIVGFDTFSGFRGLAEEDGLACRCQDGSFSVPEGYEGYLGEVLGLQEALNPVAQLKKFELVKGDVRETLPAWLERHPETIVSLAVFDFDIYAPTRAALEAIRPHLSRGAVLVFDELADPYFPGETVALREVFDLARLKVERWPHAARVSWVTLE